MLTGVDVRCLHADVGGKSQTFQSFKSLFSGCGDIDKLVMDLCSDPVSQILNCDAEYF